MAPPKFQTLADALVPCAEAVFQLLKDRGYRVRAEVPDYAAPFTPTITAKRDSTTLHVEVIGSLELDRLKEWVSYGKSAAHDTRLSVCVPATADPTATQIAALTAVGLGLFVAGDDGINEIALAVDLAMNIELPKLEKLPTKVKGLLGHSYEQFDRGEWREGFESACNALEEEARKYFAHWSRTGRIKVSGKSGPKQLSPAQIKRLTLGQLAGAFRNILTPTSLDVAIEQALTKVNPDRVARTHRRRGKRTEANLRKNVGQHMWLIANILKQLV